MTTPPPASAPSVLRKVLLTGAVLVAALLAVPALFMLNTWLGERPQVQQINRSLERAHAAAGPELQVVHADLAQAAWFTCCGYGGPAGSLTSKHGAPLDVAVADLVQRWRDSGWTISQYGQPDNAAVQITDHGYASFDLTHPSDSTLLPVAVNISETDQFDVDIDPAFELGQTRVSLRVR